ncbi:hypothetical protein ACN47E_006369 [Coniothyrium glycines]
MPSPPQHLPSVPILNTIDFPHRSAPAQYIREPGIERGWYQDGRRLRQVQASKAFIWPKDGRNGSTWGRMKDVLSGKGPDVFIAFGATKGDCVANRPSRAQWSGHTNLDDRALAKGFNHQKSAQWTVKGPGGRAPGLCYDFRTRKHGPRNPYMWTDAIWQQEPYTNKAWNMFPHAIRNESGQWFQDWQYMPQFLGGPVSNEFGVGWPWHHFP